ncbi:class I SAM-dependent methyltransferase [Pseudomonas sp. NPDC089401]|uniref:class I SAM-dependent methyltransferase n=1 Tax=Pseudomonas sp. NPDC089401 TaxID=3364462 RepID=UPI0037F776D3
MPSSDETAIPRDRLDAQAKHLVDVLSLPPPHTNGHPASRLREPIGPGLNDLFLLRVEGVEYLGRKLPDSNGELGSRLAPHMLLGLLLEARWDEQGWHCLYQPVAQQRRRWLFQQALQAPSHRVHFPFPELDEACREQIAPSAFWDHPQTLAARLDRQEQHFRATSIALLDKRLPPGAVVHDPACSTGMFIATLARALPTARCVGADRSAAMIAHARAHHSLPNLELQLADAHAPVLAAGSCDALILRFLNAEMMTRETAITLFERLTPLMRPGGVALVFGQSTLLFEVEQQARRLGLEVIRSLAGTAETLELFQFYELVRPATPIEISP